MSLVTTGAETWAAHTHRHHAAGSTWLFGPEGPTNSSGIYPAVASPHIGSADFLFWNAAGATGGGQAYAPGQLTIAPSFPAGSDPGSVIAWYVVPGGNGGPGIVFDAILETAGNWIDWDATNDPFSVVHGTRGPQPDADDSASTSNDSAIVEAAEHFPGSAPAWVFDQWLIFGADTAITGPRQVTQPRGTSGTAFAVYRRSDRHWKFPDVPVAYDPWWWLKNSPVEFGEQVAAVVRAQSEVGQLATLLDLSQAVSEPRARAAIQEALYRSLAEAAQGHLDAGKATPRKR